MPTPLAESIARRSALGVRCEVAGCLRYVDRIGRYCDAHGKRDERNGHPTARAVSKAELRPLVSECADFITAQGAHPGVRAALDWLTELLAAGRPLPPWRVHGKTPAGDRVRAWLAQLAADAVRPDELLATVCACYLLRERDPRRFPPCPRDRFFRHQLALRVLRRARGRWLFNAAAQRGTVWRQRITVGTRDALAEILIQALGALALNAARHIDAAQREQHPALTGQAAPFIAATQGKT